MVLSFYFSRNSEEQNLIDALENLAVDGRKESDKGSPRKELKTASTSSRGTKRTTDNKAATRKPPKESTESKKLSVPGSRNRRTSENKETTTSAEYLICRLKKMNYFQKVNCPLCHRNCSRPKFEAIDLLCKNFCLTVFTF